MCVRIVIPLRRVEQLEYSGEGLTLRLCFVPHNTNDVLVKPGSNLVCKRSEFDSFDAEYAAHQTRFR